MKLMLHYLMKHKKLLLGNFICVFGFIIIELGLPTLLAAMLDKGILNNDFGYIKKMGLWMILITVIGVSLNVLLVYFGQKITTKVIMEIRDDMYENIQTFSHNEYDQIGVSSLITRTTNDAYQVMIFIGMILKTGLLTPLMFIVSLFLVLKTSPGLSLFVFFAIPILLLGVLLISKYSDPLSKRQQKNLDGINRILRENLSGLRVIRAFVNEKFEEKRFEKVNENYADSSKKLFKLMALAQPAFFFLFNIIMALIIWFGAVQINNGSLQIGNLIAFIEYIFHALFSFMLFASVFMMYPRASVSAQRIQEVLELKTSIKEKESAVTKTTLKGYVEFQNVSFAYPGQEDTPTIENVSFKASPGETVAIIGSTGCGKTSMVQLIPRFYDVNQGKILVDGVDIRDYKLESLRKKIGYVPQKALLFTGTIAENLRYGKKEATESDLEEAIEIAQAKEFVDSKSLRFEERLSEGGSNFSGGQKQRLAIARAVIRKPEIYIFDDSFSALDYQTDFKLRQRLKKETKESTTLIVAQRVGTIMHADKILVLNEGKIIGMGTHKELLQNCSVYYDIAKSQLSEEELA
ncbi:ABC transporter ATP-binding protein [Vagococcus entomophilus]|uniref:Multidrug ABC transporter ATP-binding protein n=1 Tax=Vagococcus entomophilus TaxID=1160095 RepID=A0A430AIU1_9ENTE|nr:ABC transporter ATP-binding protein [Vagococcus entomophilus]RSU08005.1 multidrug ABC transporter ATP-binding protein [Vagococcus entomophilus]